MTKFSKLLALGAVLAASSSMAFADSITVSGADTFTQTGIQFPTGTGVVASTQDGATHSGGIFAPFLYQIASLNSFDFASAAGTTVFTVSNATNTETLKFVIDDLNTTKFGTNSNGQTLNLSGDGTFSGMGFGSESGTFSLTSSAASPNSLDFSFQLIGAPAVTPEPNSLVLLGTGLVAAAGMLFMRRRNALNF